MTVRGDHFFKAVAVGTTAGVVSAFALGILAKLEGKRALQPINATSHWLNGTKASSIGSADVIHTGVGYATHMAATVFWAAIFLRWLEQRPPATPLAMLQRAAAMSAIAAAADYLATPKRFTPGWEFVISKRSMAAAYGAMAFGLALGASVWQTPVLGARQKRYG